MLWTAEDFKVESTGDFLSFMVVAPFVGLVFPFLAGAWTLGFFMDKLGWLET